MVSVASISNNDLPVKSSVSRTNRSNNDLPSVKSSDVFTNDEHDPESEQSAELKEEIRQKYTALGITNQLLEQLIDKPNTTSCSDIIESSVFTCFASPPVCTTKPDWREGHQKSAFNYILIDPRITQNLPARVRLNKLTSNDAFRIFIQGIFYIGKGSRARPYGHLYESINDWNVQTNCDEIGSKKIQKIIQIWNDQKGVVSLHCFQSVIPCEAYTREAAMIDALGIDKLTNKNKGCYYGESKKWDVAMKRHLGTILLKKAFRIFLAEGERQITPNDI